MLLQTNSYIVPRDKRAEHARLLRRFRQTLLRLGCDHFEVFEQVGANWSSADSSGRFVQIMRFRDRKHQSLVQTAERNDPSAQALLKEFCELINLTYQQQQGLFAVGYYTSFLRMPPRSDGAEGQFPGPAVTEESAPTDESVPAEEPTPTEEPAPESGDADSIPMPQPSDESVPAESAPAESDHAEADHAEADHAEAHKPEVDEAEADLPEAAAPSDPDRAPDLGDLDIDSLDADSLFVPQGDGDSNDGSESDAPLAVQTEEPENPSTQIPPAEEDAPQQRPSTPFSS